jgi:hypothetical protein
VLLDARLLLSVSSHVPQTYSMLVYPVPKSKRVAILFVLKK